MSSAFRIVAWLVQYTLARQSAKRANAHGRASHHRIRCCLNTPALQTSGALQRYLCTQVELEVSGITSCESYPSPLPDLFTGLPLLVSGRFTGDWPEYVVLRGLLPEGERYSQKVRAGCALPSARDNCMRVDARHALQLHLQSIVHEPCGSMTATAPTLHA